MSIIKPLFLGILTAFFALVIELSFPIFFTGSAQTYFFAQISLIMIISVFVEESLKYAVICKSFSALEKKKEIFFSSLLLGAGFAGTEILLDIWGGLNILQSSSLYLLGIFGVHIITAGFSGYLLSKKQNIYFISARAVIFNILIHLSYNIAILYFF